jgi:hypothetical protein
MLARVWEKDFGVLAVPHHTQVVALLVFRAFLRGDDESMKTLVGQVGTGEGKSMLIASLALYVASQTDVAKRKKVHVIGSDERLVLRDFESFKGVFNTWFAQRLRGQVKTDNFAVACAGKLMADGKDVHTSIPDDAWIVYCEAKHVTSYYTQKARTGQLNPKIYEERILIIDEVDALIVDKDPTDEFVYDIGARKVQTAKATRTISEYVKELGLALFHDPPLPLTNLMPQDPTSEEIFRQVSKLVGEVRVWKHNPDGSYKDDTGSYMRF